MPRGYTSSPRAASVALASLLIGGTALLRGGVDLPVVGLAAAVAAAALALSPRRHASGTAVQVPLLPAGLAACVVIVAVQLVPVPLGLAEAISPATADLLREALGPLGASRSWRPLSLAPAATAGELPKAAALASIAAAAAILAESRRRRDQLLRAVGLSGVVLSIVHYGAALVAASSIVAPRITFVNPNHAAAFFQLTAWTALGFALRGRGPVRVGWLAAFALSASGVFLSLSRGAIGAFFVGGALFAILALRRNADAPGAAPSTPRRTGRSTALAAGTAVVAAVGLAGFVALDAIAAELRTVSEITSSDVKLGLWADAVQLMREFPLVGIGRGAFATVSPAYERESSQLTFTHVENEWLQLPVDLGLPIGTAVVALFAWAFAAAARPRDLSRPLAGGLAGAAAVAAHNLFDFSLAMPGVAIPFSVVAGIASRDMPRLACRRLVVPAAAAGLLLLAVVGLAVHAVHPPEREPASVAAAASADEAVRRAAQVVPWHPADWVPLAAAGTKLVAEGRCAEAAPWLTRAMRRNPYAPEPHRVLAVCLAGAGQHALAKQEFRLAFLYGDRGALAAAFAFYREPGELLALAPRTPEALLEAGRILRDDPREAARAWLEAWESFGDTSALAHLAAAKLALGEHEDALRLARTLQGHRAATAASWVVASRALDALGRGDDALVELETGAARFPGNAEILVPLGHRQLASRRFSKARAAFDAIVATEGPALARKRILVARALEGQGRFGEALREAQVARDVAPGDLAVLEAFSRIAAAGGRYADAVDALEVAARARPGAYDGRLATLRAARDAQRARLDAAPARPAPRR